MKIDRARARTPELAAVVCATPDRHGIRTTLAGGACAALYSGEGYVSEDLDFVTESSLDDVERALDGRGFARKGRIFAHPRCRALWLDLPAPPLSVGGTPIRTVSTLRTKWGSVRMLSPTDPVCARLSAYYHGDDPRGLEQALLVARDHEVDMRRVRNWSRAERRLDKFRLFAARLRRRAAIKEKA